MQFTIVFSFTKVNGLIEAMVKGLLIALTIKDKIKKQIIFKLKEWCENLTNIKKLYFLIII